MDPVLSPVVGALTSTVVKSVLSGKGPGDDEWASFISSVLTALLARQLEIDNTLNRIERKIDALATAPYRARMAAGRALLDEARPSWRTPEDRRENVAQARHQFTLAESSAVDSASRAIASWHVALTRLLSQDVQDMWVALVRSRTQALDALLTEFATYESGGPALADQARADINGDLWRKLTGRTTPTQLDLVELEPENVTTASLPCKRRCRCSRSSSRPKPHWTPAGARESCPTW